jgi:hypothetical protein
MTALRDMPIDDLKLVVRDSIQELLACLITGAGSAHDASIHLTLREPETSAALGEALDIAANKLNSASHALRDAQAGWEAILQRTKRGTTKGKRRA